MTQLIIKNETKKPKTFLDLESGAIFQLPHKIDAYLKLAFTLESRNRIDTYNAVHLPSGSPIYMSDNNTIETVFEKQTLE